MPLGIRNDPVRVLLAAVCLVMGWAAVGAGAEGASSTASAAWPYRPGAAWPVMRGDLRNSGRASLGTWQRDSGMPRGVQRFRTGNGVFSTPVIDEQERIYVGSADRCFYVLDPRRRAEAWRFQAGEIIDSAAALGPDGAVYFPAGDAKLYALDGAGRQRWAFDVLTRRSPELLSFSPSYWWEGNVAIGPDGALYAGNDDFYFYCVEPNGAMRWAFRTGGLIWANAAFDDRGTVYVGSFDMNLYALDRTSGKMKWKVDLNNFLIASPAIDADGTIYQGVMDGKVHAVDSRTGTLKWTTATGGHVYASAAVSRDGRVYVTSADGRLYAFDAATGAIRWTFDTGDALRSSPALGPDPEGKAAYLIYFGGGQGLVYAIDPEGRRRWSYDAMRDAVEKDYPNINASPALGRSGLAIAASNGDVLYVPYDYYTDSGATGISRDATDGFPAEGAGWYAVSPGGLIDARALPSAGQGAEPRAIDRGQVISLRLVVRQASTTVQTRPEAGSVQVGIEPPVGHRVEIQGDGRTVNIIPQDILPAGSEFVLSISGQYRVPNGPPGTATGRLRMRTAAAGAEVPIVAGRSMFRISHMAFPQPAIVPTFNQIGIASLSIPMVVIEADPVGRTFVAWGVQTAGLTESGEPTGLANPRCLFYAFSGRWSGEAMLMTAENLYFDYPGLNVPADLLRLSGPVRANGGIGGGASLMLEIKPRSLSQLLVTMTATAGDEGRQGNFYGDLLARGGTQRFLGTMMSMVPAVSKMVGRQVWKDWDFYNHEGKALGVGTFRMSAIEARPASGLAGLEGARLRYDPASRCVVGRVRAPGGGEAGAMGVLGIALVDRRSGRAVPINYTAATQRRRLDGGQIEVMLRIPDSVRLPEGQTRAHLLTGLMPLVKAEF